MAQSPIAYIVVGVIFPSPSLPLVMSRLMCPSSTPHSTALNFSDQNHEPWRRSWISLGTDPGQAPPAQSCFALSPKTLVGIGWNRLLPRGYRLSRIRQHSFKAALLTSIGIAVVVASLSTQLAFALVQ